MKELVWVLKYESQLVIGSQTRYLEGVALRDGEIATSPYFCDATIFADMVDAEYWRDKIYNQFGIYFYASYQ